MIIEMKTEHLKDINKRGDNAIEFLCFDGKS